MNRSLARLAATLLVGASVAACSSLDSGDKSASNGASHAKSGGGKSLASDIDAQVRSAQALRQQGDYKGATRILAQLMLVAPDSANVVEIGRASCRERV